MRLCPVSGASRRHHGSFLSIMKRQHPCGSYGCALFLKRSGSTVGLSFVSCDISHPRSESVGEMSGRRAAALCFRSLWEVPRNSSSVSCEGSVRAVHTAAPCFGGVVEALLIFPLYQKREGDVREAFLPAVETRIAMRRAPAPRRAVHSAAYRPCGQHLHARALDTPRKRLRSVYDILHPVARTPFHQQRLIARIRSTLLLHSCNTSSARMRSVPEEPAKHEECFQDTPSMFQKHEGSVPVPAMRNPPVSGASRERYTVSETLQERERSVVRREREVLKKRRGGVLSFRTQEVLTGTEVKEMPPGCPGGVKVWIFY